MARRELVSVFYYTLRAAEHTLALMPMLPRARYKKCFICGDPPGSIGKVIRSYWINLDFC